MGKLYLFRKDLFELIEELKTDAEIIEAGKILFNLLKEDKLSLYTLTRRSKLLLDKSQFKPNYTIPPSLNLDIYPCYLWELAIIPEIYDRLVMIDKKNNFLKQVGGIPLKPVRDLVYHVVVYNASPLAATKKIESFPKI